MARFRGPDRLAGDHSLEGFGCGIASLDTWLIDYARTASAAGSAMTYTVFDSVQERVVGYHALTVASIAHADSTNRTRKGMPQHPIPAVLLTRLAVDESVQGQGVGAMLLDDAMRRAVSVAEEAGIRLLLAHAVNARALDFYLRFGFESSPTDPINVQILIKDVRLSLDRAGG
ncbi:MAG: GNAT family N-acetyltransferase [Solirubrobacterales bacterium]|nr:GNAT family N-acetyltransferase [Solirubrobacterales bacterium]